MKEINMQTKRRNQILNFIIRHWDELTNELKEGVVEAIEEDGLDKEENVLTWWKINKGVLVDGERYIRV
jgi:hypothetical protein